MKLSDLNARQQVALRWLAANTECAMPPSSETGWYRPTRAAYAFALHDELAKHGMGYKGRGDYQSQSKSAANTLRALKERGLATSDSGGVFVQCKWWITPAGAQLLGDAEQDRNPDNDPAGGTT